MSEVTQTTLHHDLGNVLGNLRALETLLFSPVDEQKREAYRLTYHQLLSRLEKIQTRARMIEEVSAGTDRGTN